jgi:hypothetical protein
MGTTGLVVLTRLPGGRGHNYTEVKAVTTLL